MAKMRVNTAALNLRSAPVTDPNNIILVLRRGHQVEMLDELGNQTFREIQTVVDGSHHRGFASARFLRAEVGMLKERLVQEALIEWERFNRGTGLEHRTPFFRRIGEYWQALGVQGRDGKSRDVPWSAAFISFIARQAGYSDFVFSDSHDKYILDAKRQRQDSNENTPFWLFRLGEHRPQVGDMVCQWRLRPRTFDDLPEDFASHCDVLVELVDGIGKTLVGTLTIASVEQISR